MNFICIGDYECNVNATHELIYNYGDIQCGIGTNDIILDAVDPINDLNIDLELNGLIFTYDPDAISNKQLSWNWDCTNYNGISCKYLLDATDSAIVHINSSQMVFEYDSYYLFTFTMMVYDDVNLYRNGCIDSVMLEIQTKSKLNSNQHENDDIKLLIVSITTIDTEIDINDRLRLIGDIINYKEKEGMIYSEWKELNGLLDDAEIIKYKQTASNNSINLVLKEGVLECGKIYSFQLIIKQYINNSLIGYGVSSPVTIYVLKQSEIIQDSFEIVPECNHKYTSILEVLSTSLSLSADTDYNPLSYQFGYNYNNHMIHYLHSSILYDSSFSNIYLPPIGHFEIFGNVINSKSSITSQTIQCWITLKSYSICIDFEDHIIHPFLINAPFITLTEKYSFIFQQSSNYLQYLYEYDEEDDCIENSLYSILEIINNNIQKGTESEGDIFCNTFHSISLSQTLSL